MDWNCLESKFNKHKTRYMVLLSRCHDSSLSSVHCLLCDTRGWVSVTGVRLLSAHSHSRPSAGQSPASGHRRGSRQANLTCQAQNERFQVHKNSFSEFLLSTFITSQGCSKIQVIRITWSGFLMQERSSILPMQQWLCI